MKVINRAIEDLSLYKLMRAQGKELKEEEVELEQTAESFLFNENHRVAMDDYQVDIICPKCQHRWESMMSSAAGLESVCPRCSYKTNWKFTEYELTENQVIKDISLEELISLWGVEDIDGFRKGCRRRIQEKVDNKLKLTKSKEMKKQKNQLELPNMPESDSSLAKPKRRSSKKTSDLDHVLLVVQSERQRVELEKESQLAKANELNDDTFKIRADTLQATIDSFNYIESIIDKHLNQ